jgi:lipid-binding SYLF domain-containing protein
MKRMPLVFLVAVVLGVSHLAVAQSADHYANTIRVFRESPAVAKFFENSYGYAVFPLIGKGGYVIGGSYGEGQVYRRGKLAGYSSVIEGSIGFQVGGVAFSEIIFFQDKRAYDEFSSGSFEFGATAQAVVITAAAGARAGTTGVSAGASAGPETGVQAETKYVKGMAIFVHPKGGLMYDLSLGGQKFTFKRL